MVHGCIYKIENIVNNKIYIGQTIRNPIFRKNNHFRELRQNQHHNPHLQHAFNKYGECNFKFNIILQNISKIELDDYEIYYINKYNACNSDQGYNMGEGGSNGKPSLETRNKMSKSRKGRKLSLAHRKTLKIRMLGELNPMKNPETVKKVLETKKKNGFKHSTEYIARLKELKGPKNYFYGKNHSLKSRKKMSKGLSKKGLFGFTGSNYSKQHNPLYKCWRCRIAFNNHRVHLGLFEDPLSAEIVYKLVWKEIYRGIN